MDNEYTFIDVSGLLKPFFRSCVLHIIPKKDHIILNKTFSLPILHCTIEPSKELRS